MFEFFMQDISGVPLWLLLVMSGMVVLVVVLFKRKSKQKEFKKLNLEVETKNNYKMLLKIMGTGKIRKKLLWGYEDKGIIGRSVVKPNGIRLIELYKNKIFCTLGLKATYMSVPEEAITVTVDAITINPTYIPDNQIGIITFGKNSRASVDDEAYKITHSQSLNELINWLPLQSYLSVQHAQSSESLDHVAEIAQENKEDAIHKMTGKGK